MDVICEIPPANFGADARELAQVPSGDLDDAVVEAGLETRGGAAGDRVLELGEGLSERELGGDVGERVPGGLGGQSRRPRQPRVDLDDVVLLRVGAEGVLHVALAHDAQVPGLLINYSVVS